MNGCHTHSKEYSLRPPIKRTVRECYIPLEFHLTPDEQQFVKEYFRRTQEINNQLCELNSGSPGFLLKLREYPHFPIVEKILKEHLSLNKRYDTKGLEKNSIELEKFRLFYTDLAEGPKKKPNAQGLGLAKSNPLESAFCRLKAQSAAFKHDLKESIHDYKRKLISK